MTDQFKNKANKVFESKGYKLYEKFSTITITGIIILEVIASIMVAF